MLLLLETQSVLILKKYFSFIRLSFRSNGFNNILHTNIDIDMGQYYTRTYYTWFRPKHTSNTTNKSLKQLLQ